MRLSVIKSLRIIFPNAVLSVVLSVVLVAMLSGCGFHLRANTELPPTLAQVQVSGEDRDLVTALSAGLTANGAEVTSSAAARIDLHANFSRQVLTTDANGRASAYTYLYRVSFTVHTQAKPFTDSFVLRRTFDYAAERELQAAQEQSFLQIDLRREAVTRILSRLSRG